MSKEEKRNQLLQIQKDVIGYEHQYLATLGAIEQHQLHEIRSYLNAMIKNLE